MYFLWIFLRDKILIHRQFTQPRILQSSGVEPFDKERFPDHFLLDRKIGQTQAERFRQLRRTIRLDKQLKSWK